MFQSETNIIFGKKPLFLSTLFRMGGQKVPAPNNFSPVTTINVGISPQNFLF